MTIRAQATFATHKIQTFQKYYTYIIIKPQFQVNTYLVSIYKQDGYDLFMKYPSTYVILSIIKNEHFYLFE